MKQAASLCLLLCWCAGADATNELFNGIQNVILRALLAVQPTIINDKHCFEVGCKSIMWVGQMKHHALAKDDSAD